jgi:hypothetical protein
LAIVTLAMMLVASLLVGDKRTKDRDGIITSLQRTLAATESKLAATTVERDRARSEVDAGKVAIAERDERIRVLSETAQHWLSLATDAAVANDDAGDAKAIALLDEVPKRWPLDPLVPAARERKAELERRVTARAEALRTAQAEVRRLIGACTAEVREAKRARDAALVFNAWNDVDLNAAFAGERQAKVHDERAASAQTKAREQLARVPDPEGALAREVANCRTE